jgi:hypothetical protein
MQAILSHASDVCLRPEFEIEIRVLRVKRRNGCNAFVSGAARQEWISNFIVTVSFNKFGERGAAKLRLFRFPTTVLRGADRFLEPGKNLIQYP